MMKGDFSRLTFDPKKHYRRVLMQQGRVQVDADWNEQEAINQYRAQIEARDVIGRCGAPLHDAGFQITVNNIGELVIGKGRFYADGILCENEDDVGYLQQPDLPDAPKPAEALKALPVGIVYLDVWERHLTALDDPRIREVALGGPDTATRSRVVWQVKILPIKLVTGAQPTCASNFAEWDTLTAPRDVTLNARTQPTGADSPCLIPPTAGYQRLENQLYRVEVHKSGALGAATFKWSRDNGSILTTIEKINGQEITVGDVGPDNVLGFANGQWVEVVDDRIELLGQPGPLIQIDKVDVATRTVTLKSAPAGIDETRHPKLRRWDSPGELTVEVPATNDGWIGLEGGIEVHFAAGDYRTGDYWLIPARTATGEIEWPPFQLPNATPQPQPPSGIEHHYCRLALVHLGRNGLPVVEDCRPLFPPLTEVGADQGIHVTAVNLNATRQPLSNDSDVSVREFAQGIEIVCDADVFPGSLISSAPNNPVCFITLDLPFPFSEADRRLWGDNVIGFQPIILAAIVNIVNEEKNSIKWLPMPATEVWLLQRLFSMMQEFKRGDRVLAHLALKGNFVWALSDPRLYLDGEVFGFQRDNTTEARFPSGDGVRGGDLEMWFWLVPSASQLLKVKAVRILGTGDNPNNPDPEVLATMSSPAQPLRVGAQDRANVIEVRFTAAVDQASVVNGKSFIVTNASTGDLMKGQIIFTDSVTLRWVVDMPGAGPLPRGRYRISLKGDGGSVITSNGVALDGEPFALPSGNNSDGGDFEFTLTVD
jgi:hypothetical protein